MQNVWNKYDRHNAQTQRCIPLLNAGGHVDNHYHHSNYSLPTMMASSPNHDDWHNHCLTTVMIEVDVVIALVVFVAVVWIGCHDDALLF